ncbi:cytochrome c oxidase subunit III [Rhodopirellula maiorica SM1]|uniref:Cytochrome c oxidase subunit III n=1 Tax=Rhodopirellula maiorica SM1 TaxID=1265738 RepID=M5RBV9_9BACT|nr:cytochrome c oxidase subunit 3 [Rhodopirellula maiorica]EMI16973.1 cytochrome c oxidase subunit III [Rhodopirellula maiorica SM1]
MSTLEADSATDAHGDHDHDHDHPSYLAHHFDTPEQQFDSGKLGIWIFLVTEVLFFGGMFCAYAIFRMLRPEVFEGCSQFLNTKLGAINTGVLLFSSLTMAWAVRCSQTENHKGLTALIATTLSCAMVFLGVKAIEYSHKFHMGLLPAGLFSYDPAHPHHEGGPNYLAWICAPFVIALVGVVVWYLVSKVRDKQFQAAVALPLIVVCASFFGGVGLGTILESGDSTEAHAVESGEHADGEHVAAAGDHDAEHAESHDEALHAAAPESAGSVAYGVRERLATDATNTGVQNELTAIERQAAMASGSAIVGQYEIDATIDSVPSEFLTPSRAGVFFSIYYCMTGVHAIHILAGIGVLVWLLVRSIRQDFNHNYFGPVDYVGLYWHLVDLIWIYLFPLLYLIR